MSEEQIGKENNSPQSKDIDLVIVVQKIWIKRKLVIRNCGIAAVVGIIIAFSIPKEYETKVTLAPEMSASSGVSGSLGSLANMAGINLGSMSGRDAISPELYPEILQSTPFIVDLFNVQVVSKKGDVKTTLYNYLDKHQKSPWFSYITSAPSRFLGWVISLIKEKPEKGNPADANYFDLTYDQADMVKAIQASISSVVNKKTDEITLAVRAQDPLISATLADTIQSRLQMFITTYRTNKARKDLAFAEKLYKEAQKNYMDAQHKYAMYADGNLNIVLQRYKAEEERLTNEMNLTYNVYNQVAQQLQLAKAKVQEQTPVYTVIQPAAVSLKAVSPKKLIILVGFVFLVFIGTAAYILLKEKIKF